MEIFPIFGSVFDITKTVAGYWLATVFVRPLLSLLVEMFFVGISEQNGMEWVINV